MASLPLVGAQAVILGMTAFNNNARTVNSQLAAMGRAAQGLERASTGAFSGVEASGAGLATGLTGVAVTVVGALAAMGAGAIALATKYEQQMAFIGAVSQDTSDKVQLLSDAQLELSGHSTQTASQLATMSEELVKAGFSVSQITGSTLKAVNDLVVASNGELKAADAAVLAQVAVAGFHTDVVTAADAATAAVQRSTLTFTDFAAAIRQGGGVAAKQGLTIQEFAATVATVGLTIARSGSEIGTGLRMLFQRLQDPSKENIALMKEYGISLYDAAGNARPFYDVLASLEEQFGRTAVESGKVTQAQRDQALASLFGGRAVKTVAALLDQGTDAYLRMLDATGKLKAADIAEAVLQPTAAQAQLASNNIAKLGISFGQGLDPYINTVTKSLVKFLQGLDKNAVKSFGDAVGGALYNHFANLGSIVGQTLGPAFERLKQAFSNIGTALAPLLPSFGTLQTILLAFVQILSTQVADSFDKLANGLNLGASAISLFADVLGTNEQNIQGFISAVGDMAGAIIDTLVNAVQIVVGNVQAFFDLLGSSPVVSAVVTGSLTAIVASAIILYNVIGTVTAFVRDQLVSMAQGALNAAGDFVAAALNIANAFIHGVADNAGRAVDYTLQVLATLVPGMGFISSAASKLSISWGSAWSGIASITGRAIAWILSKINGMLDGLASIPLIGDAISGARAAVGGFLAAIPTFTAPATDALGGFVSSAIGGLNALKSIKPPTLEDFTSNLKASYDKAKSDADAIKRQLQENKLLAPAVETEPGSYPGGDGGGGAAAKKAAQAVQNGIEKTGEVIRDFNDDVIKEVNKTNEALTSAYTKAFDAMANAVAEHDKDVQKASDDATKQITELDTSRAIQADADKRRSELEDTLDTEAKIRQKSIDDEEQQRKRALEDADRDFAHAYREREKALDDTLDKQARARDKIRENEDIQFKRDQRGEEARLQAEQDVVERGLKARQDAEETALKARQDIREKELKDQLDAEEAALKAQQDAREEALKVQLDAEKRAWQQQRDLDEINRNDAEQRATAQAEFQAELARGVKRSIAQSRLDEKLGSIGTDTEDARNKLQLKQQTDAAELAFDAQQNAKLAAQQAEFDAETLAQKTKSEQALQALRDEFDNQTFALRAQHEQELTTLHEQQERARIDFSDRLENEALERSRKRAEEDRIFAQQQETKKQGFIDKEEKRQLVDSREREDYERWRKSRLDDDEVVYRKEQDAKRAKLTKDLDDEEYTRRVTNINNERDERIRVLDQTLGEEQTKVRNQLAQDIIDLRTNMDDRIAAIRENYLDKLDDIVRDAGAALQPVVDQVLGFIETKLDGIKQAALEATGALADTFKAADNLAAAQSKAAQVGAASAGAGGSIREGGKAGETPQEVYNFGKNMGMSDADAKKLAGLQYGGVVNGPYGSPQLVMAHGGERFEGIGGHASALTAVRMAESMAARGIGVPTQVTNNYEYSVDANYGQVQPYGSVIRDLSALVALTRK